MGKRRSTSRVDQLPPEAKERVNELLADTTVTYWEIVEELKGMGFEVSKSSIGRYALRQNAVQSRLMEAHEQTQALVKLIRKHPEADYTEPSMQMLMAGLTQKLATAQEEFDAMDLAEAGRLIVMLSRTKVYKDKVQQDMRSRAELAFEQLEQELLAKIKNDPVLAAELRATLQKAKAKVMDDAQS